ncbi:Mitotic spindle assembly checkpoint protein MAD1 [Conglomerata obtusa]
MDELFQKYKNVLLENEKLVIELQRQRTKCTLLEEELHMSGLSKDNVQLIKLQEDNIKLQNVNKNLENKIQELLLLQNNNANTLFSPVNNDQIELENKNRELEVKIKELESNKVQHTTELLKKKLIETEEVMRENELKFRDYYIKSKKYVMGLLGYDMNMTDESVELLSLYAFQKEDKFVFQVAEGSVELLSNEFAESYKEEIETYLNKGRSIPGFLAHVTLDLVNKKTFN